MRVPAAFWRALSPAVLLSMIPLLLGCEPPAAELDLAWIEYPEARRVDQVDVYYDVEVPDPYRWLEEEGSSETQGWLEAQDTLTERFFGELPEHAAMKTYYTEHWYQGAIGVPVRRGEKTFFWRAAGEQDHPVLLLRRGEGAEPEVIFDLNQEDEGGELSTEPTISVSPQGRYVSFPIHRAGADAAEIHLYDTEERQRLPEVVPTAYLTLTDWLPDESGFFYTWVDLPTLQGQPTDKPAGIYRHQIGTPIGGDPLVYRRPWEGMYMASAFVADDERHLLIQDMNVMGSRGGWGVSNLEGAGEAKVQWLIDPEPKYRFALIGSRGSELFLITDHEAPNWRIVAASLERPGIDELREVVAERDEPISVFAGTNAGQVALHEDRLYVTYIQHNSHVVRIFDLQGSEVGTIELPFLGTVTGIGAKKEDPVLYVGLESFLVPAAIYAYDTQSGSLEPLSSEAPPDFGEVDVRRVFYSSKDGTEIPMTILRRADTPIDGSAKVMLYGYGGWGIPLLPSFDPRIHGWLHLGGIYAVPNLRGGGEYGDRWHQAGQFFNKQNVFDDFAAAARYLVDEGYTTQSRITIVGGSNGGLLTAASYNQHPELFGAVISEVAAVDLLRLPQTPIGATITMELGAPSTSEEMFRNLLGYSPLHNVRHEGPYPPILHMVGENDPRCKPGHIYKYVAEMQQTGAPERIVILRVVRGAGHGSARRADNVAWMADETAFGWAMTE